MRKVQMSAVGSSKVLKSSKVSRRSKQRRFEQRKCKGGLSDRQGDFYLITHKRSIFVYIFACSRRRGYLSSCSCYQLLRLGTSPIVN